MTDAEKMLAVTAYDCGAKSAESLLHVFAERLTIKGDAAWAYARLREYGIEPTQFVEREATGRDAK